MIRIPVFCFLLTALIVSGCSPSVPLSKKDLSKVVLQDSEVLSGYKGSGTSQGVMLESVKNMAGNIQVTSSYESQFEKPNQVGSGMYLSDILVFANENDASQVYTEWIKQGVQGGFTALPTPIDTIGDASTAQVVVGHDPANGAQFYRGIGLLWRYKEALGFLYQETTPDAPIDLAQFTSLAKKIQGRLAG